MGPIGPKSNPPEYGGVDFLPPPSDSSGFLLLYLSNSPLLPPAPTRDQPTLDSRPTLPPEDVTPPHTQGKKEIGRTSLQGRNSLI